MDSVFTFLAIVTEQRFRLPTLALDGRDIRCTVTEAKSGFAVHKPIVAGNPRLHVTPSTLPKCFLASAHYLGNQMSSVT